MTKIGIGIVLFNPKIDRLKKNIEILLKQNKNILLFDNGSSNLSDVKNLYKNNSSVTITGFKDNKGIAAALNGIMDFFSRENFDWVLTFDQDSVSPSNLVALYLPYTDIKDIGIISPTIWDLSEKFDDTVHTINPFDYISSCITSGSLTKISSWKSVDGYDETMFIDLVDFDFCLRIKLNGINIIRVNNAVLRQQIGNSIQHNILGRRIPVDNHSATRKYYQSRNEVYYARKYKNLSDRNKYKELLKIIIKTIFFEKMKITKLKSIGHGIFDGKKMNITPWKQFKNNSKK